MFKKLKTRASALISATKTQAKKYNKKASAFIQRRPMASFLILLGLFLAVLILGKVFHPTKTEEAAKPPVKTVKVFSIGQGPKAGFQAKVEKSGVVTIVAQAPGIVQSINAKEGQQVGQGGQIVALSSNYQGGNAASVQRQIAQAQYQNAVDTYDTQVNNIGKQREVATNSAEVAQKTRDISKTSLDETSHLINDNQKQLESMKQMLSALQLKNVASLSPSEAESLQTLPSAVSQLQGGIYQLNAAQRPGEYQASNDNAPAKLSNLQKDITLQQLDVQEKGLGLSKEVSKLQADLAAISEGSMYPSSPFAGVVERVFVKVGQSVSPGTPIATVSSADTETKAVLAVPESIAKTLSATEESVITVKNKTFNVKPSYVSSEATEGMLYSVIYDIPKEYQGSLSDGEFIQIQVPISTNNVASLDPMIPIDAIYQTQDDAFVLLDDNGKAKSRSIKLGSVYGNYVEVLSGLDNGDQIILDRNVVAEDRVEI